VPILTLIAGPNGSGKSTVTQWVDFEGRERLLDVDTIARCLNPANPHAASIAAARYVLNRTMEYLDQRVSFAVETTLSGRGSVVLIRRARSRGYAIHLVFIGLDTPERCITRIRNRVALGGHFVPETDVRRRYTRSIVNARQIFRSVDVAKFYDNSGDAARLVLVGNTGTILWQARPLPGWLSI
jgi:predicted ABC-type ATPase